MGRFVIAAYTPRPGKADALMEAVRKHQGVLRAEGLVTDRAAHTMRAADGTILEVFEWASPEAIDRAHKTPAVQLLWQEFGDACEYTTLKQLAEADRMFAEFEPVEL